MMMLTTMDHPTAFFATSDIFTAGGSLIDRLLLRASRFLAACSHARMRCRDTYTTAEVKSGRVAGKSWCRRKAGDAGGDLPGEARMFS
jgi:hypothetical protein